MICAGILLCLIGCAFCGAARSTPRLLSCVKKVGKDTPKTSWFLDFQQKGALPPLDTPSGTRNSRGKRGGA